MTLHYGNDFDGIVFTPPTPVRLGELYAGPKKLLAWLEAQLGSAGYPENTDYLRIELYRQALQQYLLENGQPSLFATPPFFHKSFESDRFATAAALLGWRDELLLAGWDFQANEAGIPPRLLVLARVEEIYRKKLADPEIGPKAQGFADRFAAALTEAAQRPVPLDKIFLYEPPALQPPPIQRFLQIFSKKNLPVEVVQTSCAAPVSTRLGRLQRRLMGQPEPPPANGQPPTADPSLLILHARRDSDAAVFLAQLLGKNTHFRPLLLIPEMNRSLEQALDGEGCAALGVLSASLARPSLQVLKLAPAFLWEPVDVFKLMEFLTLPLKPLDAGLALEMARVLAEKPGIGSDAWFATVYGYLERDGVDPQARRQYEFWFGRRRHRIEMGAPKADAVSLYDHLHKWALVNFGDSKNATLLVLAEQARRIRDLLQTLPEARLTFLELERIVRTVYEPAPVQVSIAETDCLAFVHQPGAVAAETDELLWWNCLFQDTTPKPDHWQATERQWLLHQSVALGEPRRESERRRLQALRPVLQTARQLVLLAPEQADGAEAVTSLLLGDIKALLPGEQGFELHLDRPAERQALARIFRLPETTNLTTRPGSRPRPHLIIPRPERIPDSEHETATLLDSLFYYPHRWFFRQKLRFFPSSLLSVTGDTTLLGSLAHRFFEMLFDPAQDLSGMDQKAISDWVNSVAPDLLEREGATLLLYGREPERLAFLNRVKRAAWSLVSLLRNNGWSVLGTEIELDGHLGGIPVRGKADLVLRRDQEMAIVDLKWSGARRRKELIQNEEDLQLVLYAKLLPPPERWAHTAYFIMEDGKMIARNRAAFTDAIVAGQGEDHAAVCERIFQKMEKTLAWRLAQIRAGRLELRQARTASDLDELYAEENLFDLLEMKREDARWDDYRTLLEW